ncbi:MAG: hypothetical protein IJ122_06075 [Methanobrevibacter sp.]|nr:hypothetical protein [Methanobrevibacter sp.]
MKNILSELSRKRKERQFKKKVLKEINWTPKDMTETINHGWNLDSSIAIVVYYSTKRMIEFGCSYPPECTPEEWKEILQQINEGMKIYLEDKWFFDFIDNKKAYEEKKQKVDKALELIKEWFYTLWD